MKILFVARKSLIEVLREIQLLALELLLPIVFLGITAATYNSSLQVTYSILVNDPQNKQSELIDIWQAAQYSNGRPIFKIKFVDDAQSAEDALKEKRAVIWVTINNQSGIPDLNMRGDALNMSYYRASALLNSLARRYFDRESGRPELFKLKEESLKAHTASPDKINGPQTMYDLYAPGMIVLAILMLIPQTAMLVSREIRWKTLRRLRLTRLSSFDLLMGISLSQLVVAFIQVLVIFLAAVWMGFHNQGSFWLALLVGMVLSFSSIGMGFLVACFVENDSQAANVGATITMLQVFLSGAFYQLPPMTMFRLAGHQIDIFDIFPATHSFLALQQVLTFGNSLSHITFRLLAALIISGIYFGVGVMIFQKKQMATFSG
ncbi:MAG: ABC transporter permease [Anaerolineales bacterium]|nr:ABC transporter permease [Anaerolineales bacterium]